MSLDTLNPFLRTHPHKTFPLRYLLIKSQKIVVKNRLAKERARGSFLVAKQKIDSSRQIENEKNARENPG